MAGPVANTLPAPLDNRGHSSLNEGGADPESLCVGPNEDGHMPGAHGLGRSLGWEDFAP